MKRKVLTAFGMTSIYESAHSANSNNIVIPNEVRDP